ncbi:hypothetical protein Q2T40_08090 [Winogradskyella maritima]|uniref:Apea-like HEPN domain-containing protein n=1 Tax=Winogradskyella maritima TaxID=1517766 RepID=A0ABV8AJ88_9FLAO|nr:hypothetical protein [Winogradskyella maritima]
MKEKLQHLVYDFLQKISKVYLAGEITQPIITDFDSNLPEAIRKNWAVNMKKLIMNHGVFEDDVTDESRLFYSMILGNPKGEDQKEVFEQILLQQEFISYFAHLEAVLQDIQRYMYKQKPELLPEEKEIKWKHILELKDFSKLLEHTIDEKLNKSGYLKISDLIVKLNSEPFLLKISLKKELLNDLEEFILIRNMIIHNGSKITKDLNEFASEKYTFGDKFSLDRILLNQLFDLTMIVAVETYASVCSEIYEEDKKEAYNNMSFVPENAKNNYKIQKGKRK